MPLLVLKPMENITKREILNLRSSPNQVNKGIELLQDWPKLSCSKLWMIKKEKLLLMLWKRKDSCKLQNNEIALIYLG